MPRSRAARPPTRRCRRQPRDAIEIPSSPRLRAHDWLPDRPAPDCARWAQSPLEPDPPSSLWRDLRLHSQRDVRVLMNKSLQPGKLFWRDADNREVHLAQAHCPPNRGRIAAEFRSPKLLADDHHGPLAFVGSKGAAERGLHADNVEKIRTHGE